jgi:hypothetical protein
MEGATASTNQVRVQQYDRIDVVADDGTQRSRPVSAVLCNGVVFGSEDHETDTSSASPSTAATTPPKAEVVASATANGGAATAVSAADSLGGADRHPGTGIRESAALAETEWRVGRVLTLPDANTGGNVSMLLAVGLAAMLTGLGFTLLGRRARNPQPFAATA